MVIAVSVGFLWENLIFELEQVQEPNLDKEISGFRYIIRKMNDFFSPQIQVYPPYMRDKIEDLRVETEDAIDAHVFNVVQQRSVSFIFRIIGRGGSGGGAEEIIRSQRRKFEELYNKSSINQNKYDYDDERLYDGENSEYFRQGNSEISSYVVEFPVEEKMLITELISGAAQLGIIQIVGMSGDARSTLAGRVFYDPVVASHFDLLARVWVSPLQTRRDCLEAIMKSVVELTREMKEMSDQELLSHLRRNLECSRYLIVVDGGYYNSDLCNYLSDLLPRNMFGSRIILTVQSKDAIITPVNFTCELLPLSTEEDRRDLLFRKVFGGECPPELKRIGYNIAERCMGLPLATVLIGGVLQWRKTPSWWERVDTSLGKINVEDEVEIFELIYSYLPHHLKLCLLYLGHFPEECEISARQLITLWIAEGFIVVPKDKQRLMEEAAVEYLEDLSSWNLIQPAQRKFDGGVKSFRIHDFLRVLCMSKAREVKDLEVRVYDESSSQCMSRRISIHSATIHFMSSNPYAPKLRSLLCFGQAGERVTPKHWKSVYNGYKLLRVLELWGVVVDNIPSSIEKLICLRYLRLKSDSAKILPLSICNLLNLQTLEVVAPLIERPQVNIWKMQQLRHFYFNGQAVIPDPPQNVDEAEHVYASDLQTLSTISPDSCRERVLSKAPSVVKLGIYGDLETHKKVAFNNLSTLKLLRKLKLVRDRRYKRLAAIPNWVKFPPMLVKLTLLQTELSVDPMKQLAQLPNLQVLKLIDSAYGGAVLDCSNCEFHKLKVLKLVNMDIKCWSLSIESMPSLENLVIDRCGSLVDLPSDGLKNMSTLRELQLRWPNLLMVKCAREIATYKEKKMEQLELTIYHAEDVD